jgi:hypothetical protein
MLSEHHRRLLELRPLHLVHETSDGLPIEARRRRGRPRKLVAVAPDQKQYETQVIERLSEWVEQDELVGAAAGGEGPASMVSKLLLAVAAEAGGLGFERLRAAREGRDISEMAARRVRALSRVADLVLLRLQLDDKQMDLDGPMMDSIEVMWLGVVQETARETLAAPEPFISKVKSAMAGWRGRARPTAPR